MSNGSNISATTWLNNLDVVAWGPLNPGWGSGNYEAKQTALWLTSGPGNTTWSEWEAMNTHPIDPENAVQLAAPPCVVSWGTNRLDFFVVGADGSLWHIWKDNSQWGSWEYLNQPSNSVTVTVASAPSVVSWGANRLDVFVLGTDGNLWHLGWNGSKWEKWQNLGAPATTQLALASAPSAVSWGANRLDIFALGADGDLWHLAWNGSSWASWQNLGAPSPTVGIAAASSPCAVSWGANQLGVFVRGTDSSLWCLLFIPAAAQQPSYSGPPANPGPSSWRAFAQVLGADSVAGTPAAVSGGPNLIDVFAVGSGDQLMHVHMNWRQLNNAFPGDPWVDYYTPAWGAVTPLGPPDVTLTSPPCPVSWGGKRLDAFAVDSQGTVHHISWAPTVWSAWETLGGVTVHPE
ncbi:MAG: hypothetical protein ABSA78_07685 [Candidatus Sulfotelmatobacter sp.]